MTKPFFVWVEGILKRIDTETVAYFEKDDNYVSIYLADNTKIQVRSTLESALNRLPQDFFVQINRSTVVSVLHVDDINKKSATTGKKTHTVTEKYYKLLLKTLVIIKEIKAG